MLSAQVEVRTRPMAAPMDTAGAPLEVVQKWLWHSCMDTAAIYTNSIGREERLLAERMWPEFDR